MRRASLGIYAVLLQRTVKKEVPKYHIALDGDERRIAIGRRRRSVWVTAVIYGRRDQIAAMLDMP